MLKFKHSNTPKNNFVCVECLMMEAIFVESNEETNKFLCTNCAIYNENTIIIDINEFLKKTLIVNKIADRFETLLSGIKRTKSLLNKSQRE